MVENKKIPLQKDIISTFDVYAAYDGKTLFDGFTEEAFYKICEKYWKGFRKLVIKERIEKMKGYTFGDPYKWGDDMIFFRGIESQTYQAYCLKKRKNMRLNRKIKECIRVAGSREVLEQIFDSERW